MLHAEQLAFNAGMLKTGALLTGMDWIMGSGALAWLKGGVAGMPGQAAWIVRLSKRRLECSKPRMATVDNVCCKVCKNTNYVRQRTVRFAEAPYCW
jgi:hypothetical protein